MAVLAVALTATSAAYGYHRDELYFRMLPPQWGYVDQPPLTPLIARGMSMLVDEPWAMRLPETVFAVVTVLLVASVTRGLGGGRFAPGPAPRGGSRSPRSPELRAHAVHLGSRRAGVGRGLAVRGSGRAA